MFVLFLFVLIFFLDVDVPGGVFFFVDVTVLESVFFFFVVVGVAVAAAVVLDISSDRLWFRHSSD